MCPKNRIQVIGGNMTSAKRALQLIERGRARYVDEHTIELLPVAIASLELPPPSRGAHSPTPDPVRLEPSCDPFLGQTFLHYPQPGSFKRAA